MKRDVLGLAAVTLGLSLVAAVIGFAVGVASTLALVNQLPK